MSHRKVRQSLGILQATVLLAGLLLPQHARAETAPKLVLTPEEIQQVDRQARQPSIGTDFGLWGGGFANGLKLTLSICPDSCPAFAVRVRGILAHGPAASPKYDGTALGSLELIGRSPVAYGIVRLYGGGGVIGGGRPWGEHGKKSGIGGGGFLGVEFFATQATSFSFEVGGQSGIHPDKYDTGATVMAGVTRFF